MLFKRVLLFMVLPFLFGCQHNPKQKSDPDTAKKAMYENTPYLIYYDALDEQQAEQIVPWLNQGQKDINQFFDSGFKKKFEVFIFSERDSLDLQWQKDWNMPGFKSECWMVASGIAHRLDILSPRIWETQACEHSNEDTLATKKLMVHELVHVFHGQHNPSPTFENVDNIDWLVEGLAVYASGQLDKEQYERAKNFMLVEEGPNSLANIWKGEHKYGLAGSMVKFIDDTYGRKMVVQLIGFTQVNEVLGSLQISEEELIRQWKQSFNSKKSA